jgi:ABC-type branched-subunit amino acid transport system permease subunit
LFKEIIHSKWFVPVIALFIALLLLPFFAARFYVYIIALIFVTSLLAMSLNLVVGHGMANSIMGFLWVGPILP